MTVFRSSLVFAGLVSASCASAAGLEGTWMRSDGNARVRIAPCGSNTCATNIWIKDTSSGEAVGDQLIMTLSRGAGDTFSGSAFDTKRKLTFNITIKVTEGALDSRGCLVGKMICRQMSWRAVR